MFIPFARRCCGVAAVSPAGRKYRLIAAPGTGSATLSADMVVEHRLVDNAIANTHVRKKCQAVNVLNVENSFSDIITFKWTSYGMQLSFSSKANHNAVAVD